MIQQRAACPGRRKSRHKSEFVLSVKMIHSCRATSGGPAGTVHPPQSATHSPTGLTHSGEQPGTGKTLCRRPCIVFSVTRVGRDVLGVGTPSWMLTKNPGLFRCGLPGESHMQALTPCHTATPL